MIPKQPPTHSFCYEQIQPCLHGIKIQYFTNLDTVHQNRRLVDGVTEILPEMIFQKLVMQIFDFQKRLAFPCASSLQFSHNNSEPFGSRKAALSALRSLFWPATSSGIAHVAASAASHIGAHSLPGTWCRSGPVSVPATPKCQRQSILTPVLPV